MDQEFSLPPFKSELTDHPDIQNEVARFQAIKDNPGYVVKEIEPEGFEEVQGGRHLGETTMAYMERQAAHGLKLLHEFSAETKIAMPASQLLVGANPEGNQVLYRLSEQVMGSDLKSALSEKEPSNHMLEELANSIFNYYKDKIDNHREYTNDIAKPSAYRYGRTVRDPHMKIYMIDTDPYSKAADGREGTYEPSNPYYVQEITSDILEMLDQFKSARPGAEFLGPLEQTVLDYSQRHWPS
jgi:hypothetical protein